METFLQQARDAAQQQNWARLVHCLEQLLSTEAMSSDASDPEAIALALQVLEFGDFHAQWDAAKLFSSFGHAAIAPLIALMQNEDAALESRWFAVRILGECSHPTAIRALIDLLQTSDDDDLSAMAATALATLGDSAIAALSELLSDASIRPLAVQALTQIRRSETIAPLLTVVDDPDPSVRALAIDALSSFHDQRVPPVLAQALTDKSAAVRRSAVVGLGVRADLAAELELVSLLSDRLRDLNLDVCQQAAIALGRLGTDAAATSLFNVLKPHTPLPLQLESVRALGWIGSAIALDYLHQVLSTIEHIIGDAEVRRSMYQEIITVLGRWTDPLLKPHAAKILLGLLDAEPVTTASSLKSPIALALGQLGQPPALDPLIGLLAEADVGVRLHAIAALKTLDARLALQRLERLAVEETVPVELQQGVAIALQEWGQ
ncbi:HEAT repeat domain-containing protein [Leptolyngbya sp. FACHB-36]|uniref:HEAT repeat domain-containing protein n=1 Tax=Leptolyngbya sp. FACHB-36 TaxID=2692808 RepID=UPI00168118BB|nr:HEAT repeat domain-containing protein [Leptolyngbya sp. FACHB-36]MBD2019008.1 HEAT repeat domain-containing protein [Leptolyngbya sp. FACHB-36]